MPNDVPTTAEPTGSFTVRQAGEIVARGYGPLAAVRREAAHYAAVYRQDGPVTVRVRADKKKEPTNAE